MLVERQFQPVCVDATDAACAGYGACVGEEDRRSPVPQPAPTAAAAGHANFQVAGTPKLVRTLAKEGTVCDLDAGLGLSSPLSDCGNLCRVNGRRGGAQNGTKRETTKLALARPHAVGKENRTNHGVASNLSGNTRSAFVSTCSTPTITVTDDPLTAAAVEAMASLASASRMAPPAFSASPDKSAQARGSFVSVALPQTTPMIMSSPSRTPSPTAAIGELAHPATAPPAATTTTTTTTTTTAIRRPRPVMPPASQPLDLDLDPTEVRHNKRSREQAQLPSPTVPRYVPRYNCRKQLGRLAKRMRIRLCKPGEVTKPPEDVTNIVAFEF